MFSFDAWIMSTPSRAFQHLASQPPITTAWRAMRRPLFLAFVFGCLVSLLTSGVLTARIVAPATIYWAYVPVVEALALTAIVWRRSRRATFPMMIDAFFAGHAPWTLLLIGVVAALLFLPPEFAWRFLTRWCIGAVALVIVWSAYIDFCFFRHVVKTTRVSALRNVVLHRLLTWTMVFAIFAVPGMSPRGLAEEVRDAVQELLR